MKKSLPSADIYNKENKYMLWGILINELIELIAERFPQNSTVIDLMCGTGFLAREIKHQRPDLQITGVDINEEYIDFAKENNKNIEFIREDVMTFSTEKKFDLVLCTAGFHHVEFNKQQELLFRLKNLLAENGICISADPFIDSYKDEKGRSFGTAKLGYEYINAVIKNDAPDDILKATIDILERDLMLDGEYKTSVERFNDLAKDVFNRIESKKTWPQMESEYGDYYFILSASI